MLRIRRARSSAERSATAARGLRRRRIGLVRTGGPAGAQAGWWSGWSCGVSGLGERVLASDSEIRLIRRIRYSHCRRSSMTDRRSPSISSRKQPQQARSTELVAAILQAAVQVLAKEGAQRFTTARVAEKAGVSVGSLYQYFPNKAAILFRLQSDEWRQTTDVAARHPGGRREGRRSNGCAPSSMPSSARNAMRPRCVWRSMTPHRSIAMRPRHRRRGRPDDRIVELFMQEALPTASEATRALAGDLITTTLSAVGKAFFGNGREPRQRSKPMPTPWPICFAPILKS